MIDDSDVVLLGKNNHSPVRRFCGVGAPFTPRRILPPGSLKPGTGSVWKGFLSFGLLSLCFMCVFFSGRRAAIPSGRWSDLHSAGPVGARSGERRREERQRAIHVAVDSATRHQQGTQSEDRPTGRHRG